ncbi:MAG: deoxyribose-phosphate aldolase [Candidatus Obscuribacterales bacterium]|nr:deoxyribose-phosphate aldolase [Candidatus Obscuribacterales bacterium]
MEVAKYIDHTNLNPAATSKNIERLCDEAKEFGFFAVCVNPYFVKQAVKALSSSNVAVATVIGFPLGQNLTDIKIAEAQRAISEGAEELDLVINIAALKDGQIDYVRDEIKAIVKVAKDRLVKVIIECDLLTNDEKVAATKATVEGGAGMVKTSTGFVKDGKGATVEDIRLMKETIGSAKVGIKASAGIRDFNQAKALIDAGATRLGTSASVGIVQGSKVVNAAY